MFTTTRPTTPPTDTAAARAPGWGEIVAGLVLMGVALYRLPPVIRDNAAALGHWADVALLALPAVAAFSGFFAAARPRIRTLPAIGIRGASPGALLAGVGLGVVALAATIGITAGLESLGVPAAGARPDTTVLGLVVLGLAIPVAQELLLRGVVTTALLRHGAVAGILGSTVLSAGAALLVWMFLPTASVGVVSAAVIGFLAAILLRRTGSVWPGVLAHVVCNGLALAMVVLS
ncbi:CPBP family intramembrane glutamic endopeptidase [Pseudonocardia endophytica]|uniref:CAAX prenyl protease 2/Lysostaphin resistance protein A-like domain-containing protein n=1 Tax=Pseudonocardia endophytica TaxID=401976 RepID=A0A4R1HHT6_PSEEN|nr:CPBP family glutamic-type intramembrane protease [Pseudonocardia endophytica]TCK21814.1 hypothetical protein EV378_5805 [Pseudonocardia endophytica]